MHTPAQDWIQALNLQAHPEGGYFAETYRSDETLLAQALPQRYHGDRPMGTAIYFLLESHQISALHRLQSDELWFFHTGAPLKLIWIEPDGTRQEHTLGTNIQAGEHLQCAVPRDVWVGAYVQDANVYSLVSCTVAPGFAFDDFELAGQAALLEQYPQHADIIKRLT